MSMTYEQKLHLLEVACAIASTVDMYKYSKLSEEIKVLRKEYDTKAKD